MDAPADIRDTSRQDRALEPPRAWIRYRSLVIVGAVLVIALGGLMFAVLHAGGAKASVDRARLTIATVERGSFVRDIVAEGQVVAAVSPTLYSPAAGNVGLKVHAGDPVAKGQILALIDSPDLTAKLTLEQATLQSLKTDLRREQLQSEQRLMQLRDAYEQAEVDRKTAQRELERSRKAYELGAYSELQTLRIQDALEKAQFVEHEAKSSYQSQGVQNRFDISSRQALLDRQQYLVNDLQRQVDALQVRSPVDGKVGQVQVSDRASVAKDTPLVTVVDLSALEVEVRMPESLARDIASGMTADLEGDGRRWKGTVSGVSPQVVNGEVVARLRFSGAKPEGLRQSQRLSARIFIDRRENVLMIERGSFMDQDGGQFAYKIHQNIAQRGPIRLGAASMQKVEILDGAAAGDQIVVNGTEAFNGAAEVFLTH